MERGVARWLVVPGSSDVGEASPDGVPAYKTRLASTAKPSVLDNVFSGLYLCIVFSHVVLNFLNLLFTLPRLDSLFQLLGLLRVFAIMLPDLLLRNAELFFAFLGTFQPSSSTISFCTFMSSSPFTFSAPSAHLSSSSGAA
ncbi:hypothetical protein MRX96_014650 [Rhipicephalus microplus]